MARVQIVNPDTATGEAKSLLKATGVEIDFPKVDLFNAPARASA